MSMQSNGRELTMAEAINEAIREEMGRDENVVLWGEDVGVAGGVFKVTKGILKEFGPERVFDTPISEAGIVGLAVGAAMTGLRPVVEVMFGDFLTLAMDQLVNQAAKIHYMSGGSFSVPMVVRTTLGAGRRTAAQHSQSLHAWVAHIPGLKVVLPSCPYDAKGLLKTAIRDNNPVVFFEDKIGYQRKGLVPKSDPDCTIPFGRADVKREGSDLTIIATSSMVHMALTAASKLADDGIQAEVIDPRTLVPLDKQTLIDSVKKTSRCMVIDQGYQSFGVTAEIAALVAEQAFYSLDGPVRRLGGLDVPIPFSPSLEDLTIPTVESVTVLAQEMVGA
ncbi:MAG: alpha-ketoacid dehydrogenase subunit beta [Candidatus Sulfotelmatobacter sp.]